MKTKLFIITAVCAVTMLLMSSMPGNGVISKEGAFTVVNTTTLAKSVEGYNCTKKIKIYISKGKIKKIETLKNQETLRY